MLGNVGHQVYIWGTFFSFISSKMDGLFLRGILLSVGFLGILGQTEGISDNPSQRGAPQKTIELLVLNGGDCGQECSLRRELSQFNFHKCGKTVAPVDLLVNDTALESTPYTLLTHYFLLTISQWVVRINMCL